MDNIIPDECQICRRSLMQATRKGLKREAVHWNKNGSDLFTCFTCYLKFNEDDNAATNQTGLDRQGQNN